MNLLKLANNLPNGAQPVAITVAYGEGVILCHLPYNNVTPWVTWSLSEHCTGYSLGHYFQREENARLDFAERSDRVTQRQLA